MPPHPPFARLTWRRADHRSWSSRIKETQRAVEISRRQAEWERQRQRPARLSAAFARELERLFQTEYNLQFPDDDTTSLLRGIEVHEDETVDGGCELNFEARLCAEMEGLRLPKEAGDCRLHCGKPFADALERALRRDTW